MPCFASSLPVQRRAHAGRATQQRPGARCSVAPRSLNDVVKGAGLGLDRGSQRGIPRLQVDALVPGLNPGLEDSFPYNEKLLLMLVRSLVVESEALRDCARVALLFKSEGTAASARAVYSREGDLPENVTIASYYIRDGDSESRLAGPDGYNIVINPVNARGNPVILDIMKLVEQQPDAGWILLNGDFTADRSALGIAEVKRRQEFLDSFKQAFYFRNLFIIKRPKLIAVEKGALLYSFDDGWTVFQFQKNKYKGIAQFVKEPTRQEIGDALESAPSTSAVPDVIDDKAYLTTIGVLAVAVSGLFWFLSAYPNL